MEHARRLTQVPLRFNLMQHNSDSIPLRSRLARGSVWMVGMRWSIRLLGFISTIIVARVLTPEDFGVVAMASLVVLFLTVFSDVGIDLALIRHPNPQPKHYNTAWTYGVLFAVVIAAAITLGAPFAASFFQDPRIESVLPWMALVTLLSGFKNIYTVDFRRELLFHKDFQLNVLPRLVSIPATICFALVLRSYWAIVLGMLTQAFASLTVSYYMSSKAPRFSLEASGEIWSFSGWILLRSIAVFLNQRLDQAVVGRLGSAGAMGTYYMAAELASILAGDLIHPIGRALMPGYVRLRESMDALAEAFAKVLSATSSVALLFGLGLALHAESVVTIVLGEQWVSSAPILSLLALDATVQGFAASFGPLMTALDKVRFMAAVRWLQFALFALLIFIIHEGANLTDVASAKLFVGLAVLPLPFLVAARVLNKRPLFLLRQIGRPLLAATSMVAGTLSFQYVAAPQTLVTLAASVSLAGLLFVATLTVSWLIAGRPDGPELMLTRYLRNQLTRKRAKT